MDGKEIGNISVYENEDGEAVWEFVGQVTSDIPLDTESQHFAGAINELSKKLQQGEGGDEPIDDWQPPADWLTVPDPAENEIYGCFNREIKTDCFEDVEKRISSVEIEHKDFEALIKQYDRPDALFYCDPPYHTTEDNYSERFSEADHYRLNGVLMVLKGRFILSYNDDDFIRELYKDFNIQAILRGNNLSSGKFKEVIIKNF